MNGRRMQEDLPIETQTTIVTCFSDMVHRLRRDKEPEVLGRGRDVLVSNNDDRVIIANLLIG